MEDNINSGIMCKISLLFGCPTKLANIWKTKINIAIDWLQALDIYVFCCYVAVWFAPLLQNSSEGSLN